MKLNCIIGILFLGLMVACRSSTRMQYKLSDERMAHLLFDIQLAEVTLADLLQPQQDSLKILIDKRLEEIYHLSREEIKKEMDQLQSDPEKLKWVVGRVKEMADSIQ